MNRTASLLVLAALSLGTPAFADPSLELKLPPLMLESTQPTPEKFSIEILSMSSKGELLPLKRTSVRVPHMLDQTTYLVKFQPHEVALPARKGELLVKVSCKDCKPVVATVRVNSLDDRRVQHSDFLLPIQADMRDSWVDTAMLPSATRAEVWKGDGIPGVVPIGKPSTVKVVCGRQEADVSLPAINSWLRSSVHTIVLTGKGNDVKPGGHPISRSEPFKAPPVKPNEGVAWKGRH